jgi:pyruvate/2-oxoglutarate dehydrogenase complex dihydrolipoamide acyltransferase (E2) component
MTIEIYPPHIDIVSLKEIREATISLSNNGSMTIEQFRKHIRECEKALLELEYINQVVTQELKQEWRIK